jgi:hypothetical protein
MIGGPEHQSCAQIVFSWLQFPPFHPRPTPQHLRRTAREAHAAGCQNVFVGMYARIAPGVDPARQKAFIVLWSTFNLLSCAGFLVLLGIGISSARGRRNAVLLSFETVFALTTGVNTMLTWTGHVGNAETPWTLCLISGSLGSALASGQAVAACVLVVKVGMQLSDSAIQLIDYT